MAQLVEVGLRAVLGIYREELPASECEGPGQDPGADFHRPLGDDRRIGQAERVRRAGFDVCQPHRDAAHPVGLERHLRQVGLEVQAQVDLPQTGGRIGQVFQVFGTEIVISPVAQQLGDSFAFEREAVHVVLRPHAEQGRGPEAVHEMLHAAVHLRVGDLRIVPGRRYAERIVHLCLPPVFAVEQGVCGVRAEIAVIFEHLFRDLRPEPGLYLRDQHGLFGQPFE